MKFTVFGELIIDIPIISFMIVLPGPDDARNLGFVVIATGGKANAKQGQQHDHQ